MHTFPISASSWQRLGCIAAAGWALFAVMPGLQGTARAADAKPGASAASAAGTITEEQATAAALKVMPGKVTGVTIEKKRGKMVYVIEIMTATKGEKDVLVDRVTGKVIGTD